MLYLYLALIVTVIADDFDCDYTLKQSDFDDGTYRITTSGNYCLSESIVFDPNPISDVSNSPNSPYQSSFPNDDTLYPGCQSLSDGAFALGFFAAISIETDNVELNLNSYQISMSKSFYIQQRLFTVIEIGNSPFVTDQGPVNFGISKSISNVYIHDGILGLSSQFGIHSNDATNVTLEKLRICEFETAGVELNGFDGLIMNNLIIGPSSIQVKPSGTYANARFLSYALYKLLNEIGDNSLNETIIFQGERTLTIQQIYDNLILSMDIAYRYFFNMNDESDKNEALYLQSIELYSNPVGLPDGSSLYGIVTFSGTNMKMSNIKIQDLKLNVNEVPASYFDECMSYESYTNDYSVLKGAFGNIMDLRRMVGGWNNGEIIDLGDDITHLQYVGNPLSDAQIALSIFGNEGQNDAFLKWALNEYNGESYQGLPQCVGWVCNRDNMFNQNEGIMGLKIESINNVEIENIVIKRLTNKSPLPSYAFLNYTKRDDIHHGLGTDTKGIYINDSDVIFDGFNNVIQKLISFNGDVVGLNIKEDVYVIFDYVFSDNLPSKAPDTDTEDDKSSIEIRELCPGYEITFALLAELIVEQKYPYPNTFYACNILVDNKEIGSMSIEPYPPNGIDAIWCADNVPDDKYDIIGNVLPIEIKVDAKTESDYSTAHLAGINVESKAIPMVNAPHYDNKLDIYNENIPYLYFIIGIFCIIMVVFVLVTFIMKCGNILMNGNRSKSVKNQKYKQAKYVDTDDDDDDISDATEDEI
eukprot:CAMPEP_0201570686 /NCGR_PEP_ID=MMETSP0190_2-20130828/13032_1 /ASSEMBLY_ACC=CAM_ASM_000263 /TAXON_ID=37353 /ORGANISM="Rosalina sp." /LENGTH=755 /DNA_ID=CAMNT_0047994467 /DNA_START=15 /DNA_END=2282 /DNA_ORIENTATION=+